MLSNKMQNNYRFSYSCSSKKMGSWSAVTLMLPKRKEMAVTFSFFERLIYKQTQNLIAKNMKTSVKTLFVSALTAVVLSTSAFTSVAADKNLNPSEWSVTIDFNKVVVTGNVNVELVQADNQKVVITNEYNEKLTTVKQKGDKLFINSKEDEPIHIIVYVKDLQRIDASNSATVNTRGCFSSNVLQVFLKDKAKAYVNGEIGSLYTLIKDNSQLKLKGTSEEHFLVKSEVSKLKMDNFASVKTTTGIVVGSTFVQTETPNMAKDSVFAKTRVK